MPPALADSPVSQKPKYKMRLINSEFMEGYGKLPAGSVIVTDQDTAARWLENGIAVQAGKGEKTAREIKREQTLKQLRPIGEDEIEDGVVFDQPKQRPLTAARTPRRHPRAGSAAALDQRAALAGAGAINGPDAEPSDDDEITVSDDED